MYFTADPATQFAGFPSLVRFDDDHLGCAFAVAPSLTHGDSARNQSLAKHKARAAPALLRLSPNLPPTESSVSCRRGAESRRGA